MVFHVLMAAKMVPLLHAFNLTPLLWPFNLRVPLVRQFPRVCEAVSSTSTLLSFRLRRILSGGGRPSSWERAIRLFWYELFPPLTGGRFEQTQPPHQHQEADHRHRSVLLNALDASIIQGLLSVSI